MEVTDAILTRRSVKIFKDIEPVKKEVVEELLEAATMAPNHRLTEPWRFFVLQGDGRLPLSRAMGDWIKEIEEDPNSDKAQKRMEKMKQKSLIAPTVIVVALSHDPNGKGIYTEDVSAVSAAVQNILLSAHSKGLGAIWKSGAVYNSTPVKKLFKLGDNEEVLGVVFIGESDMKKEIPSRRTGFEDKTVWFTEDEA